MRLLLRPSVDFAQAISEQEPIVQKATYISVEIELLLNPHHIGVKNTLY